MNYTRIKDENAKLENDLKNQKRNTYIEGHVSKLVKLLRWCPYHADNSMERWLITRSWYKEPYIIPSGIVVLFQYFLIRNVVN